MITRYFITLLATLLLSVESAFGQNTLTTPDVSVTLGSSATLPVNLYNKDEVVALQFTLTVPEGISINTRSAKMTERADGHSVTVRKTGGNTYTAMVVSGQNKPIKGNSGTLLNLGIEASSPLSPGDEVRIALSDIIITGKESENIASGSSTGTIFINSILYLTTEETTVSEGGSISFVISVENAPKKDLSIIIGCDMPDRVKLPTTVILPAGETSVEATVEVLDNKVIEQEQVLTFTATATNYIKATKSIVMLDNDVPTLQLALTPSSVAENAGVDAVTGTVSRTDNIDVDVTIKITTDAGDKLYLPKSAKTLTMKAGQKEVSFNFGPVDNGVLDGNRSYNITASVYLSDCNCSVGGESIGSVTATLVVLDNEGPTLKLTSASTVVKEGGSMKVDVTKNTSADQELTVNLSSNHDEQLEYPSSVTIPQGQTSTTFTVKAKTNDVQGDDFVATLTVSADSYAPASIVFSVTDRTLPDAQTTDFQLSTSETKAGSKVTANLTVANTGNFALAAGTKVNIFTTASSTPIATLATTKSLKAGGTETLKTEFSAPKNIGIYHVYAKVNSDQAVEEQLYTNNSSNSVELNVLVPFTVNSIQTDKKIYASGDNVKISGTTTGASNKNVALEIYIINKNVRQTLSVTTDATGAFSTNWTIPSRQGGHFSIGASYPSANEQEEMCGIEVYGLLVDLSGNNYMVDLNDNYTGKMTLTNLGEQTLTGVKIEPLANATDASFSFNTVSEIQGDSKVEVKFIINGNALSDGQNWKEMPVKISSNEGNNVELTIYYYVRATKAKLICNPNEIVATLPLEGVTDYPLVIRNIGKGASGKISLALLPWIKTVTASDVPSLAQGDSTTIVLRFSPTSDMIANQVRTGNIGINCENGSGVSVEFSITPVTAAEGHLIVDVMDEFSFYGEEKPHVSGAKVSVLNYVTKEVVAEGTTNKNGLFEIDIKGGRYTLRATAEKHIQQADQDIIINAGKDNLRKVFLPYNDVVDISYDVVPTEIEDEYVQTMTTTYETRVPKPQLDIQPLGDIEEGKVFQIVVTNNGLLTAKNVIVTLEGSKGVNIGYLSDPTIKELAPRDTFIISAKYSRVHIDVETASPLEWLQYACYHVDAYASCNYTCGDVDLITGTETRIVKGPSKCVYKIIVHWPDGTTSTSTYTRINSDGHGGSGNNSLAGGGAGGGNGIVGANDNGTNGTITKAGCFDDGTGCATTVTLQFSQTMAMTREAFRGTLTVKNNSATADMKDVTFNATVKGLDGQVVGSQIFQIDLESTENFEGVQAFNKPWLLAKESKGVATVLYIPTKNAAPKEPLDYQFGGTLSYIDPTTGVKVNVELNPVTLTVHPSPELNLSYFLQRDVLGYDPLLEETGKWPEPAEFALVIQNKGYGDAKNVNITTTQPKLVKNEDGLLFDIQLKSAMVNGDESKKTISNGESLFTEVGTIKGQSSAYIQWWLESSLLGHFTDYDVKSSHLTSRDNPDLSLVSNVSVHELIHGFTVPSMDDRNVRGFLVDDEEDENDTPDHIHFSTGETAEVTTDAMIFLTKVNDSKYTLSLKLAAHEWNYGSTPDPTFGNKMLISVRRKIDGMVIPLDNFWQTWCTLRDNKPTIYENRLHFILKADKEASMVKQRALYASADEDEYELTFTDRPDYTDIAAIRTNEANVQISPLPLREWMYVSGDFNELRKVDVLDLSGNIRLQTRSVQRGEGIYVGALSKGIYLVRVTTDKGTSVTKVVKK
ncbi:MAG: T9SS type A sorting domain-containing protein [Bacteroidaceae bacterium]|nr:T9SS type A sorting domain-containing protein [Bacteroidaceae bacterium]